MTKRLSALILGLTILCTAINAQSILEQQNDPYFGESCTSIMVSKGASADGSVITSHTCDGRYRTWMTIEKGETFENDTITSIYKGRLRTETPWDMRGVKEVGQIPQAKETYAFLNTAYPCLNEKQLAIGETTTVGPKELINENGMFQIEELERIAARQLHLSANSSKSTDTATGENALPLLTKKRSGRWKSSGKVRKTLVVSGLHNASLKGMLASLPIYRALVSSILKMKIILWLRTMYLK